MKKYFMLLFTAFLVAVLGIAASSLAGTKAIPGTDTAIINAMCAENGTLYFAMDETFYQWKTGENEPAVYAGATRKKGNGVLSAIFSDSGKLYGLDSETGSFYSLADGAQLQLAWDLMTVTDAEGDYPANMSYAAICDGRLFAVVRNWNIESGKPFVASWDLTTGQASAYSAKNIQAIVPYQAGKLLAIVYDADMPPDADSLRDPIMLCVFDPATDTLAPRTELRLDTYGIASLHYDTSTDTAYFVQENVVYRMVKLGQEEICGYLPSALSGSAASQASALIGRQLAVYLGSAGIVVTDIDPALLPEASLRIYGGRDDQIHRKAASQLGNIPFILREANFNSAQELIQLIVSGDDTIDLYCLDLDYIDFKQLMEKGYCQDLSGNETLTAFSSAVYPYIQEATTRGGAVYAIPINLQAMVYLMPEGINELAEEGVDIRTPHSFTEFCEFISEWNDILSEKHDNYQPFLTGNYRTALTDMAMSLYGDYLAITHQTPTFDTPVLREVMRTLESVHTDNIDLAGNLTEGDVEEELFSKRELFSCYSVLSLRSLSGTQTLLSLTPDTPAGLSTNITVLFINPRSRYIDLAVRYLEAYVSAMDEEIRIMLCPDRNGPVINQDYETTLADYDQQIASIKTQLEAADPADRAGITVSLERITQARTNFAAKGKYAISEENIMAFRSLMEHAFLATENLVYSRQTENNELQDLFQRYVDGQINMEQFIEFAMQKLRLMQKENPVR